MVEALLLKHRNFLFSQFLFFILSEQSRNLLGIFGQDEPFPSFEVVLLIGEAIFTAVFDNLDISFIEDNDYRSNHNFD